MNRTLHIIAEAGTNHNGCPQTAKELVDVAVEAAANSVKFQIIHPDSLYLPKVFRNGHYIDNEVYHKRYKGTLSDEDYRVLANYCGKKCIAFGASVFDEQGINLLDELNASYIKIASCDLNNSRLVIQAAERGRPLIISTGMASLREIEKSVSDICSTGNRNIVLMHCVSLYPCQTERMNLRFIKVLKHAFGFPVGLSDHTENSVAGAVAIGMGVEWIEKHLTLNRNADGFDHAYAMEPSDFKHFTMDMWSAAVACSVQPEKICPAEAEVKSRARRGLYAARHINKGNTLVEEDVIAVRPEGPLSPDNLALILGKTVSRVVQQYEPLSLDMLE